MERNASGEGARVTNWGNGTNRHRQSSSEAFAKNNKLLKMISANFKKKN
jgi:hypothetical protein